jgi:MFS family permease
MVKHSIELPFTVMMGVLAVASLIVLTARYRPSGGTARRAMPTTVSAAGTASAQMPAEAPPVPPKMQYIRFLAWTGALIGYMAVGLFRFQMPHLAKTIGMDEVVFGRVATALSLAITLAFFATARWIGWHGKTRWIFLPQAALIVVAVLMTWTTDPWVMGALMMVTGFAAGLLYASSVFYGSLGAAPAVRTRRMAIHEVCLNIGVIAGSYGGNLLSQHLGPSHVYPYLAAAIALILLVQAVGWNVLLARHARRTAPSLAVTDSGSLGLNPVVTRQE